MGMSADSILLLIAAIVPAVFLLPWRVRFRMHCGWARLAAAVAIVWRIIAVVGVKSVDAEYAAVQAKLQQQQSRGETPDMHDLMFDGTGDRLAFTMGGWIFPMIVGVPMLFVRYLIDLRLYPKHEWEVVLREREWGEMV